MSAAEEELHLQGEEEETQDEDGEVDEGEDVVGDIGDGLNPRLSRISVSFSEFLIVSADIRDGINDIITHISRQAASVAEAEYRSITKAQRVRTTTVPARVRQRHYRGCGMLKGSADNDRMVVDLERQLEEARHELAQKRKEDKELRGHELKQNIQISGVSGTVAITQDTSLTRQLEADLASVQRSLEQSKEHRANMQKMYDSQCGMSEAQFDGNRSDDQTRRRDCETC
jgi:hypothetical protein